MFKEVVITDNQVRLNGHLTTGQELRCWVLFAHGSGSSRLSPRNNWVASELNKKGYGTLLFDLLSSEEDMSYENRFNIILLAKRLLKATDWLQKSESYHGEPIAYFGASTGAAAALLAAANAEKEWPIFTVISRGGRPDLAGRKCLTKLGIPVLLIVGALDDEVIELNRDAQNDLSNAKLSLVEGATHLFEEPGALQEVVKISLDWLDRHTPSFEAGANNDFVI